tara:strand:+ start:743 stop:1336 length:594 start_codon:yes stop_codon:yes gene_type:complete
MARTVKLNITEDCDDYDLYISSKLRRSMFINSTTGDNDTKVRLNMMGLMCKTCPEQYLKLLNDTKSMFEKQKMIFLGVSNDAFVGIAAGQIILDSVNKTLDNYRSGLKVRRVVLTDQIGENESPEVYELPNLSDNFCNFKYLPNTTPPSGSLNWEQHLAVYLPDNPEISYYPTKDVKMAVMSKIDGQDVKAYVTGEQ